MDLQAITSFPLPETRSQSPRSQHSILGRRVRGLLLLGFYSFLAEQEKLELAASLQPSSEVMVIHSLPACLLFPAGYQEIMQTQESLIHCLSSSRFRLVSQTTKWSGNLLSKLKGRPLKPWLAIPSPSSSPNTRSQDLLLTPQVPQA